MATKKELVKFLNPGYSSGLIGAIMVLLGCFRFVIDAGDKSLVYTIVAVILMILGVLVAYSCVKAQMDFKGQISRMEDDGSINRALTEFATAGILCGGNLRFGDTYIFGKKSGMVLPFGQITKIYQYIHKTNGVENYRAIKVVTADTKVHELCKIQLRGKADTEVQHIVGVILSKNPSVHVGYN